MADFGSMDQRKEAILKGRHHVSGTERIPGGTRAVSDPVIIHVVLSLAPGGLERLVVEWTNVRNRLHPGSTSIVCLDEVGSLGRQVEEASGVLTLGGRAGGLAARIRMIRNLRREVRRRGPGGVVLHAHNVAAWQYSALAALGTGAAVVFTQHGTPDRKPVGKEILRGWILSRMTQKLVAVSRATARTMQRVQGLPGRLVAVIPNGLDIGRFAKLVDIDAVRRAARQRAGLPQDRFIIGSAGRLARIKNHDLLLRVFARFVQRHPEGLLLLVGDGPERGNLEQQAGQLGIADRVRLAGYREDVEPWLRSMDVFCLSSDSEGMPVALLEAGACGLPSVVTDVGGIREMVDEGKSALIVPPGDEEALLRAVERLHADRALAVSLGAGARRSVRERFSLESTMEGYEGVYGEVTGE